ncbi:MAG: hypothetical protein AB7N24_14400 [Dehalococcoidia bacterium]
MKAVLGEVLGAVVDWLSGPAGTLFVALISVGLAGIVRTSNWWAGAIVAIAVLGTIGLLYWSGRQVLATSPVAGTYLLEFGPLAIAAVGGLAGAVALTGILDWVDDEKSRATGAVLLGALSAAAAAFLGDVAKQSAGGSKGFASLVSKLYRTKFSKRGFDRDSPIPEIARAYYAANGLKYGLDLDSIVGQDDWSWSARRQRARDVEAGLAKLPR